MSIYAVAKGKRIGIFDNWAECKLSIGGYPGARYKKFNSNDDALKFILDNKIEVNMPLLNNIDKSNKNSKSKKNIKSNILDIEDSIFKFDYYVYTDGSCLNNGKKNAVAGIGIYFGENDSRNVSQKVIGKQSNNTAELGAIIYLYNIIENDITIGKQIGIVTDSTYAIRCATSYGKKCAENNWKNDIPNKDLVKQIYELYNDKENVKFLHIMAHTKNTDIHTIGNKNADILANNAIRF